MRLDLYLYQNGYAPSRQKAQELIAKGQVYCQGNVQLKSSFSVDEAQETTVEIRGEGLKYVSRGGEKLQAALDAFGIDVKGKIAVDIGASTGGFTDCLLQYGAEKVYAVDCGKAQLHPSLQKDSRVVAIEAYNARHLKEEDLGQRCDLAVMDVSFISQTQLYEAALRVLKPDGILVSLIKPQFEAGRNALSKKGIVREEKDRLRAVEEVKTAAQKMGLICQKVILSPIRGGSGNIEYLAVFRCEASAKKGTVMCDETGNPNDRAD